MVLLYLFLELFLQFVLTIGYKLPSFSCSNEKPSLFQLYNGVAVCVVVQILDFGLARHTDDEMTGYVATRWYRAPEIMLNWMHYNQTGIFLLTFPYRLAWILCNSLLGGTIPELRILISVPSPSCCCPQMLLRGDRGHPRTASQGHLGIQLEECGCETVSCLWAEILPPTKMLHWKHALLQDVQFLKVLL